MRDHNEIVRMARAMRTRDEALKHVPIFQSKAWTARRRKNLSKQGVKKVKKI